MSIVPGPIAPWRQLYALLRARIEDGTYQPGQRLPAIADLAHDYELNPTTVQKTMRQLREDGLAVSSPMGYFVSDER